MFQCKLFHLFGFSLTGEGRPHKFAREVFAFHFERGGQQSRVQFLCKGIK